MSSSKGWNRAGQGRALPGLRTGRARVVSLRRCRMRGSGAVWFDGIGADVMGVEMMDRTVGLVLRKWQ